MKKTFLLCLCALLAACTPTVANRGDILDADALAGIKPGVSTREDVVNKLGTPTELSTFNDKDWYYIGAKTEQYSFFRPDTVKQEAVEISFNDAGVVSAVKKLDQSKAGPVETVERTTPTYGRDDTLIRQLLGDISHPMPDLGATQPQQPGAPTD